MDEKSLRLIHEKAEKAFLKGHYAEAKSSYEELLKHVDVKKSGQFHKLSVDWPTYVDLHTRLAKIYLKLDLFEAGNELLENLIKKDLPKELYVSIQPLRARCLTSLKKAAEAHGLLMELKEITRVEEWNNEDRSFFRGLQYMLHAEIESLLLAGEKNFSLLSFKEAKDSFEMALSKVKASKINNELQDSLFFKICECHFHLSNYEEALFHLGSFSSSKKPELLLLKGLIFKKKGEKESSYSFFDEYLEKDNEKTNVDFQQQRRNIAKLEISLLAYEKGDFEKAKSLLNGLKQEKESYLLASLYLARIYLKEGQTLEAKELLLSLALLLNFENPLYYEWLFLQGAVAFEMQSYAETIKYLSESLNSYSQMPWETESYYRQGVAYYKLGMDRLKQEKIRKDFLAKAETCFAKCLNLEKSLLALSKTYYLQSILGDKEKSLSLTSLLCENFELLSVKSQAEALFLLMLNDSDLSEKEKHLNRLNQEIYSTTDFYSEGWFEQGLIQLQLGQNKQDPMHFEKAIQAFQNSMNLFTKENNPKSLVSLEYLAISLYYRNLPQTLITALTYVDSLLTREIKEDFLYFKGILASKIAAEDGKFHYIHQAKEAFSLCLKLYPDGIRKTETLFALGTLAFQEKEFNRAQDLFLEAVKNDPHSSLADESLFLALISLEKDDNLPEKLRLWREKLYTDYPNSRYAPETYLRLHSISSYLAGEKEALGHLLKFSSVFPDSPFLVASHYLLALYYKDKDLLHSISLFKSTVEAFDQKIKIDEISSLPPGLILFRYRSLLEIAKIHFDTKNYESAIAVLSQISSDFENKEPLLTQFLYKDRSFPPLYQQTLLTLGSSYLALDKIEKGKEIFSTLLLKFAEAKINRNAILSKVWFEEGRLALEKEDYQRALGCFECAQSCGHNLLNVEDKLTLWMAKSNAYRALGDFGQAMRTLSSIINEDVASPLRIEAMLQRAEIYEVLGRKDLALRQLQAVAKKGGELGKFASDKLKKNYANL